MLRFYSVIKYPLSFVLSRRHQQWRYMSHMLPSLSAINTSDITGTTRMWYIAAMTTSSWPYCPLHLPTPLIQQPYDEEDHMRWFTKTERGWQVKYHEAPCYDCGSSWCMIHHVRIDLAEMIWRVKRGRKGILVQSRFWCYCDDVIIRCGIINWHTRKLTGWCLENSVRVAISSSKYDGFNHCVMNDEEEDYDNPVTEL